MITNDQNWYWLSKKHISCFLWTQFPKTRSKFFNFFFTHNRLMFMATRDSEWLSKTKDIKYSICCGSLCSNCWNDTLSFNGAQTPWYNVSVRIHMTTISRTLIQNYVPLNSDLGFKMTSCLIFPRCVLPDRLHWLCRPHCQKKKRR